MQLPDALSHADRATQGYAAPQGRGMTIYEVARRIPAGGRDAFYTLKRLRTPQNSGPTLRAVGDLDYICAYTRCQRELAPDAWSPVPSTLQLEVDLDPTPPAMQAVFQPATVVGDASAYLTEITEANQYLSGDQYYADTGQPEIVHTEALVRQLSAGRVLPQSTTPTASHATPRTRTKRVRVALLSLLLAAIVLGLGMLGPTALQAYANKTTLDHELTHARSDLGIPERMLTPITSQEQRVTGGAGGLFSNYQDAATTYGQLYRQLLSIEQTALPLLRQQAQKDLLAFAVILNQRQAEGFSEVAAYQSRFDGAQRDYDQAQKPGDYAHVSEIATAQTQALQALWLAYQQLQGLRQLITSLHKSGLNTQRAQQFYNQDLPDFRNAAQADRYPILTTIIAAQIMQVLADESNEQSYVTSTLLQTFQASIDLLRQYGDTTAAASFQKQYADDTKTLAAASHLSDYQRLAQTITTQNDAMASPLIRAKAAYDFTLLRRLVDYAQTQTVINPADHKAYPIAPEYADRFVGIGGAASKLATARTLQQYKSADVEILSLAMGLRAQLDDRADPTPHDMVHQTDLQVMQYYNATAGRVVIISLAEQTARFYENGKLVYWSYVTTGQPDHPSAPGYHVATLRLSPTLFVSSAPLGSPDWYAPTPIHYAIEYNAGFYFLHDAWWRSEFGPYTNLPHHDPAAFNNGSLGCINFPLSTMQWVYQWTVSGTPIIVY